MDDTRRYDLTQGVVWKSMLKFVWPIFLGALFQSLYSTVDAIILGQYAGKEALAALDSIHTIVRLPLNFYNGLATGAMIIISQYFGAKDNQKLSNASHTAVLFAIVAGIILSIGGVASTSFFIDLVKVPSEIYTDARLYLLIFFSGMWASMIYNVGAGVLRALGNSKTPFYFLIVTNILNIILDLVFIAILKLGVAGAAVATVISQITSVVFIFITLINTKLPCKIYIKKLKLHIIHLKEIFTLGLPIAAQSIMYPISNTIIQASINSYGVNYIAAWAVCGKLDFLVWIISAAFASAISTFVAQNYGANNLKRARQGVRVGAILTVIPMMIIGFVLYVWHIPLAKFFVNDPEVFPILTNIVHLVAPIYCIYCFTDIFPSAIQGTKESVRPMIITLTGTCLLRVLWIIIAVPYNKTFMTTMFSYPLSWVVTALMLAIYYFARIRKLSRLESFKKITN